MNSELAAKLRALDDGSCIAACDGMASMSDGERLAMLRLARRAVDWIKRPSGPPLAMTICTSGISFKTLETESRRMFLDAREVLPYDDERDIDPTTRRMAEHVLGLTCSVDALLRLLKLVTKEAPNGTK